MYMHTRLYQNGRFGEWPNPPSPFEHLAGAIEELAGEGLCDRVIGERLGLSRVQVQGQRRRLSVPSRVGRGRPAKERAE